RKYLEEELFRRTLELQQADRRLTLAAHEFRNPLATIGQAAQLLRWKMPPVPSELQSICDIIERQAAHLTRLIDDLFDVTAATYGKLKLHPQPVELATVISQSV